MFAEIGGYSVLCADVNHAAQMRQGVPPLLPLTFPPAMGGGLSIWVWDYAQYDLCMIGCTVWDHPHIEAYVHIHL